jgi:serine/threonine protein kinase
MFDTIAAREIGPYVVHELIGWGGMSRVYRATDTAHDGEVAVKVLSDSIVNDPEYVERFKREIEIASMLHHPYILPVLDYGRTCEGTLFMAMPLVAGGTLADVLRPAGPMTARQTQTLIAQMGAALDYAHGFSIAHRDIKPGNIMLIGEDEYALVDFGLVKRIADLAEVTSGNVLGSPMYMSPEQARGDTLDHRTDLYSMGLVLYECLTGRLPYNPRSLVEIMGHHVTAPPIMPRQISATFPPELEVPLVRAIEKDRSMRYQSGQEMAEAFANAVDNLKAEDVDRPLVSQDEILGSKHLVQQSTTKIVMPNMPPQGVAAS